jgi:hypothetical protein
MLNYQRVSIIVLKWRARATDEVSERHMIVM